MAITGLEVFLAYKELKPSIMLTILVILSVVKAAMIMSYFMHLKFEKFSLVLWLVQRLPVDARMRQIVQIVVILIGIIALLKYLAVFVGHRLSRRPPLDLPAVAAAVPGAAPRGPVPDRGRDG